MDQYIFDILYINIFELYFRISYGFLYVIVTYSDISFFLLLEYPLKLNVKQSCEVIGAELIRVGTVLPHVNVDHIFTIVVIYFPDQSLVMREKRHMVAEASISLMELVEDARCEVVGLTLSDNLRNSFLSKAYVPAVLRIHVGRQGEEFAGIDFRHV